MNIEHHLVNHYDSGIQNRVKSDQTKENGNVRTDRTSLDLNGLKEGVVFKGEILDISGDKVTIELENQAKLLARLQEGIELGIGDRLLFSVKENQNSQILIKPLFDSLYSARTQALEEVLDAAGLSPTEKNFTAAKELMDAGMPVDKGSIVKILSQSMKYEGTSMQTLVSLNKMNVPVTADNIAQYERYQNYSHQLSGDIANTADSIADFASALPEQMSAKDMLSLTSEILDIFSKDMPSFSDENPHLVSEGGKEDIISEKSPEQTNYSNEQGKQVITDAGEVSPNASFTGERGIQAEFAAISEDVENMGAKHIAGQAELEETQQMAAGKYIENFGQDFNHLSQTLEKAGISSKEIIGILKNGSSQEELLQQMIKGLAENHADAEAVRAVITSNEFKKMLSELVKTSWSIDPKAMKKPKEIDELYSKISRQSKAFEEALSAKNGDTGQFNQSSQNMRQNMSFMEQINNQMIYAQMPLKLSNQNANSELFVYADKRKLAQKGDGISVMLHLDMDNLGMTDIKVTLTGTNVNARFYLNDQQSVDIVAENMDQLESRLLERGFSLSNEVVKRQPQESINKVVDEIIDENAERSIKRYTFDMRT
ncbi:MAG: flagellar hook-length control protein FliK [Clostridiales bacterium]|nr:flagellar hook-length control protein FliK [Clostridiales bacterium]